jgi:hypothetical protein
METRRPKKPTRLQQQIPRWADSPQGKRFAKAVAKGRPDDARRIALEGERRRDRRTELRSAKQMKDILAKVRVLDKPSPLSRLATGAKTLAKGVGRVGLAGVAQALLSIPSSERQGQLPKGRKSPKKPLRSRQYNPRRGPQR